MPEDNFAARLKQSWMARPVESFAPLTFHELAVGEKFIGLPIPGDNHGHGGFRSGHTLFVKTAERVETTESGLPYGLPHGRAVRQSDMVTCDFHLTMHVIKIV